MLDNYYKILGVNESSTTTQIKKAYHRLALKHHPDKIRSTKQRDATPGEILFFTHIKDAYEVLSSDNKLEAIKNRTLAGSDNVTSRTVRPRAPVAATTAPVPPPPRSTARASAASTSAPPAPTMPPRTRAPSVDSTSSDDAAGTAHSWWWDWYDSYFSATFAAPFKGPILDRIVFAVFDKKMQKLKELFIEYQDVPAAERATHVPKLNWLLVESAAAHENEIALLLTKFGADVNHYGEFMKLADGEAFECYFVDMLIHMNNFALFAQIVDQVDFTIYSVGLYVANNWPNPHLHHYPKYAWGADKYIEDYNGEYEHNCRKRLLWCAIFCGWVLENNRPDILVVLKDVSARTYKAGIKSLYFGDVYRFMADYMLRLVAAKSFTTERIIDKFIAVNNAPRFWQRLSHMQVRLDMRINIYPSSLSALCCVMPPRNGLERLMYFNEMLNTINGDVDVVRNALAWHISFYLKHGLQGLLIISGGIGAIIIPMATYAYIACDNDPNPACVGKPSSKSLLLLYAIGGFPLYLLIATLAARILSCGYLEIGGSLDKVINRAAINLVINQHATQQAVAGTRSPFVGFSFRSRPPAAATVDPDDVENNDPGAYHRFRA